MFFKKICMLIGLNFFLLFCGTSAAQEPLTSGLIEKWLKSQKPIMEWGKKHEDKINQDSFEGMPTDVAAMVAPVKAAGLYGELEDQVQKHGFSSVEKWADTTLRIFKAFANTQMSTAMQGVDIQAQIDQIANNPNLSAEQKKQMIDMMKNSLGMVQQMANAPAEDVAAVKPYIGQLMEVIDAQNGQ